MSRRRKLVAAASLVGAAAITAAALGLAGNATAAPPTAACTSTADNLVADCGFESGGGAWSMEGNFTRAQNIGDAHKGVWDARLGSNVASHPSKVSQDIAGTEPGTVYSLGYWLQHNRLSSLSKSHFEVQVSNVVGDTMRFDKADDQPFFDYEYHSDTFKTKDDGTAPTLTFIAWDGNNFYTVDDVTVTKQAGPTVATSPSSSSVSAGMSVSDNAVVSGGMSPTGTVSFALYGPNDPTCAGTPVFTSANRPLSAKSATSAATTITEVGTYHWVATYNGDANNNAASDSCGDEPVVVTAGTLDHLKIAPAKAIIGLGSTQAYTATGYDAYGNSLGALTKVNYSITAPGSCTKNLCTGPVGSYTVTGEKSGMTDTASLKVTKAATATTVTITPAAPKVNQAVTVTAIVTPKSGSQVPTGTMSFYVDGASMPADVETLDGSGAANWTTTFGASSHRVVAVYSGDANYLGSSSSAAVVPSVKCDTVITAMYGSIVATKGTVCVRNADVHGSITVMKGVTLDLENSSVSGSVSTNGAATVRMCGNTTGGVNVVGSTGFVVIGDPAENCAPNTVNGSITATFNSSGVVIRDNTVSNQVSGTGNSGRGPLPGQIGEIIAGNHH